MSSLSTPLASLVRQLVPASRTSDKVHSELVKQIEDILNSRSGQDTTPRETDIDRLADRVTRHLQRQTPSNTSQHFTDLLSQLLKQRVLTRKHACLVFLNSLASFERDTASTPLLVPSLIPLPPIKPTQRPASMTTNKIDRPMSAQKQTFKSKADLLLQYRAEVGRGNLPEPLLLRDVLYILQGISGKYVQLCTGTDPQDESKLDFFDDPEFIISAPVKALIHRLAELGYLYTRISTFVDERTGKPGVGMIEQSLCHYLQTQLTEYYRLIAVLESQMYVPIKVDGSGARPGSVPGAESGITEGETGLTLKRLLVWVEEWRLRLRMMSVCVEGCRDAHGGALVNLIHSYTENGDPFVREFTDKTLEEVSKPFFATLHRWLFSGELVDPYSEFFVAPDPELAHMQYIYPSATAAGIGFSGEGGFGGIGENEDASGEKEGGLRLWEGKYEFRKEMLPTFVGETFGRKIFSTGKSLNFIRYNCHDSDWVATREKLSNTGGTLKYSDITGLERSIDAAYSIASQRLFDIFFEKFKLLDHLCAFKQYLMLGHGDFADQLMEALGPSLSRSANTLYRHNLTATLEAAIRSSTAQNDPPDVLRRLDARMLEYSHGEIGWDVFTLEYKVDAPIDTVLDPESMGQYLKVFSHLWRMKRVEGALSYGWMRIAGGARTFLRVPDLDHEWHKIRIVMAEMIHFIRQLQAYCHLDVIECSWKDMLDFVHKKEGDLDALIEKHRKYLKRVVSKVLMLNDKAGKEEIVLHQVREAFHTILQFREATDNFYNYTLSEAARRDSERDGPRGVFTRRPSQSEKDRASDNSVRMVQNIEHYGSSFSERAQNIVQSLQAHTDFDCRFLAVRLSFSDFYKMKKEHRG